MTTKRGVKIKLETKDSFLHNIIDNYIIVTGTYYPKTKSVTS